MTSARFVSAAYFRQSSDIALAAFCAALPGPAARDHRSGGSRTASVGAARHPCCRADFLLRLLRDLGNSLGRVVIEALGLTIRDQPTLDGGLGSDLIARVAARMAGFDALLMPTVAITAPPIAAFERDEDYRRLNALLLRNTSVINFLDCCAITVPLQTAGPPVGLMIVGEHGADRHLLAVGRGIEAVVSGTR